MSFEERVVSERLSDFLAQDAAAMRSVRPPIPMIGRVAPRYGLEHKVPTIDDVVRVDEVYKTATNDPLTQKPGYSSSTLPGWSSA